MDYNDLFESANIRGLALENRVIFPAIGTRLIDEDGFVTDELIDYHLERTNGGVGLTIVEASCIDKDSAPKEFLKISEDKYIEKLQTLTDKIHDAKGKVGIQLWQGISMLDMNQNLDRVFPSEYKLEDGRNIKEMEEPVIKEIIKLYGKAANRAVKAGFDMIDINASHGNTLHAFISPAFNKREDKYGGSIENRTRLLIQVIREIRKNIPEDMPISLTIVSQDDYLENGLEVEDIIEIIKEIEDEGLDIINISRGNVQSSGIKYMVPPLEIEEGFNLENTRKIKENTKLFVTAMGRINRPDMANDIIKENKADFVAIGRGLLSDPYFLKKAKEGREEEIVFCLGCNQGCFGGYIDKIVPHIGCTRNPMVGREKEFMLVETEKPQKIAVIGGGIGGMVAAKLLYQRGHQPVLFEQDKALGGKFLLASKVPGKQDIRLGIEFLIKELKDSEIEIRTSTEFVDKMVETENFDSVIIATGAEPKKADLPGKDLENVILFDQVLKGDAKVEGNIIIIGGGFTGIGLAKYLGQNQKNKITIFEEKKSIGEDLDMLRKVTVKESLDELGIGIETEVEPFEIKENKLIYKKGSKTKEKEMDYLIMAVGYNANKSNDIKQYCQDREIPFYVIGDALIPRRALDAVSEAANISIREID